MELAERYTKMTELFGKDNQLAKEYADMIVGELDNKPISSLSQKEVYYRAHTYWYLFFSAWDRNFVTQTQQEVYLQNAIESFELLFAEYANDTDTQESYCYYFRLLDEGLQKRKAYAELLICLQNPSLREMALRFLSDTAFAADGFCTMAECVSYLEELVSLITDPAEKASRQEQLADYKKRYL